MNSQKPQLQHCLRYGLIYVVPRFYSIKQVQHEGPCNTAGCSNMKGRLQQYMWLYRHMTITPCHIRAECLPAMAATHARVETLDRILGVLI